MQSISLCHVCHLNQSLILAASQFNSCLIISVKMASNLNVTIMNTAKVETICSKLACDICMPVVILPAVLSSM